MSPADVVKYWASGKGGTLNFVPDSELSKIFSQGNGAKAFEEFVYQKFGGKPSNGDSVTNYDYVFTWGRALRTTNTAEHVVGSWENGTAAVGDSQIRFNVSNTMGMNSLFFGRQLGERGITPFGDRAGDLNMTIEWTSPLRSSQ